MAGELLLKALAREVVARLKSRGASVSTAESCTGGLIAGRITDVPGASDVFSEGYVTYSDAVKEKLLGVRRETLERYGAVSKETAREMADGLRERTGCDYAISVTGLAGPGGGSAEKPVGLVYIGCASAKGTKVEQYCFDGDRTAVRGQAVASALTLLRREITCG